MGSYRHDLHAAMTRVEVLEARVAEKEALLAARDAALAARDVELRAAEEELAEQRLSPERKAGPVRLASLGLLTLLLSLGSSEAFDRIERAELRYREAERRAEAAELEGARAVAALREETGRLEGVIAALDDEDGSEAADRPAVPSLEDEARIGALLTRAVEGEADIHDLRLLRALCQKEGHEACHRFSRDRLRSALALGF